MTTMTVAQAEKDLAGTLRRMNSRHEAVVLQRGRKSVAVMIPPEMIEELEDLEDIREANKAMKEYGDDPSKAVPWEQVKREAGLV
jgi:PHD/YefM family antitoxin component YafN of YafNO toxin-antitoxin module